MTGGVQGGGPGSFDDPVRGGWGVSTRVSTSREVPDPTELAPQPGSVTHGTPPEHATPTPYVAEPGAQAAVHVSASFLRLWNTRSRKASRNRALRAIEEATRQVDTRRKLRASLGALAG